MGKRTEPPDPFADYIEWSNNRYNPGHYLGGNIPPYLRRSRLGAKASRRMGISLAISASLGAGLVLIDLASLERGLGLSEIISAALVVLIGCAAVAMFRHSRHKTQQRPSSD